MVIGLTASEKVMVFVTFIDAMSAILTWGVNDERYAVSAAVDFDTTRGFAF